MHKPLKESTLETMAMLMLGADSNILQHDYRRGIGPKVRKVKKAKRRQQKQSRRNSSKH